MRTGRVFAAAMAAVALLCTSTRSFAAVCGEVAGEAASVATVRLLAEESCPCQGFAKRRDYVRCVHTVVDEAVTGGTLSEGCKPSVLRAARRSVCGRPAGAVTCCRTSAAGKQTCSVKASAEKCRPPKGGSAVLGRSFSCHDACTADCEDIPEVASEVEAALEQALAGVADPWADLGLVVERTAAELGCALHEVEPGEEEGTGIVRQASQVSTANPCYSLGSLPGGACTADFHCPGVQLCVSDRCYHPGCNYCGPGSEESPGAELRVFPFPEFNPHVADCLNRTCFQHDACYDEHCVDSDSKCYWTSPQGDSCDPAFFQSCGSKCGGMGLCMLSGTQCAIPADCPFGEPCLFEERDWRSSRVCEIGERATQLVPLIADASCSDPACAAGQQCVADPLWTGMCIVATNCGNSTVEGTEQCDGADDAACPGLCQPDCTCQVVCPPEGVERSFSVGKDHACGVKLDGTVQCWGIADGSANDFGQVTDTPTGTFVQISAGTVHNCGIRPGGTVECWGANYAGQAVAPSGQFIQVSAGDGHSCGLRPDGTVQCWGYNVHGQATPPPGAFVHVSAGNLHTCGLKPDSTVECWGHNLQGQGTSPSGMFLQVDSGAYHNCGVMLGGLPECWGGNSVPPPAGEFAQVSAGHFGVGYYDCGLKVNETVQCWGSNDDFSQVTDTPSGAFVQVSAGYQHACGLRANGSVECWGDDALSQSSPPPGLILMTPGTPGTEGPAGDPSCSNGIDDDCDGSIDGADSDCGGIIRASTSSTGAQQNGNATNISRSLSTDGNVVAFVSNASNLVAGDTNGGDDIFVKHLATGATVRVNVSSAGTQADIVASDFPCLSGNGDWVGFPSGATNLVPGDQNGAADIFVHDLTTGTTELASLASDGSQSTSGGSFSHCSLSLDGQLVAFASQSPLTADDTNPFLNQDVYVRDRQTNTTELISRAVTGFSPNFGQSGEPSGASPGLGISTDGRYVAFFSTAPDIITGGTNGRDHIYRRDRQLGVTMIVTTRADGEQADAGSRKLSLSGDGRYVAFASDATNLVSESLSFGVLQIFVKDMQTGNVMLASKSAEGVPAAGSPGQLITDDPSISGDGRYVTFWSAATNLVSGDTNAKPDVFVKDLQTGGIAIASVSDGGALGNGDSVLPAISGDGRSVAFISFASNLVVGDTNGSTDVFVAPNPLFSP